MRKRRVEERRGDVQKRKRKGRMRRRVTVEQKNERKGKEEVKISKGGKICIETEMR